LRRSQRIEQQKQQEEEEEEIVIKLLISNRRNQKNFSFDSFLKTAEQEIILIEKAQNSVMVDCLVRVYGLVIGMIPEKLADIIDTSHKTPVLGIVMRYEKGGSMDSYLFINMSTTEKKKSISMNEKIRLLTMIARGIAELHSVGIIHADIKPENILLNDDNPPNIRLADFGLSLISQSGQSKFQSSLVMTSQQRGTPLYSAPEMLTNPYSSDIQEQVAKPSRKTDMYAYGILCWEVLTQEKPFSDVQSEMILCAKGTLYSNNGDNFSIVLLL
jgi:serine/threonine protein kinase